MYDDELIGVEDVQEQELELIIRRRQAYHSQAGKSSSFHTREILKQGSKMELDVEHTQESVMIVESNGHVPLKHPAPVADSISIRRGAIEGNAGALTVASHETAGTAASLTATISAVSATSVNGSHSDPRLTTSNIESSEQRIPSSGSHTSVSCCGRYSILSEKLLDERRYTALVKSVDDLEYREQLFKEYGI